eukprot:403333626
MGLSLAFQAYGHHSKELEKSNYKQGFLRATSVHQVASLGFILLSMKGASLPMVIMLSTATFLFPYVVYYQSIVAKGQKVMLSSLIPKGGILHIAFWVNMALFCYTPSTMHTIGLSSDQSLAHSQSSVQDLNDESNESVDVKSCKSDCSSCYERETKENADLLVLQLNLQSNNTNSTDRPWVPLASSKTDPLRDNQSKKRPQFNQSNSKNVNYDLNMNNDFKQNRQSMNFSKEVHNMTNNMDDSRYYNQLNDTSLDLDNVIMKGAAERQRQRELGDQIGQNGIIQANDDQDLDIKIEEYYEAQEQPSSRKRLQRNEDSLISQQDPLLNLAVRTKEHKSMQFVNENADFDIGRAIKRVDHELKREKLIESQRQSMENSGIQMDDGQAFQRKSSKNVQIFDNMQSPPLRNHDSNVSFGKHQMQEDSSKVQFQRNQQLKSSKMRQPTPFNKLVNLPDSSNDQNFEDSIRSPENSTTRRAQSCQVHGVLLGSGCKYCRQEQDLEEQKVQQKSSINDLDRITSSLNNIQIRENQLITDRFQEQPANQQAKAQITSQSSKKRKFDEISKNASLNQQSEQNNKDFTQKANFVINQQPLEDSHRISKVQDYLSSHQTSQRDFSNLKPQPVNLQATNSQSINKQIFDYVQTSTQKQIEQNYPHKASPDRMIFTQTQASLNNHNLGNNHIDMHVTQQITQNSRRYLPVISKYYLDDMINDSYQMRYPLYTKTSGLVQNNLIGFKLTKQYNEWTNDQVNKTIIQIERDYHEWVLPIYTSSEDPKIQVLSRQFGYFLSDKSLDDLNKIKPINDEILNAYVKLNNGLLTDQYQTNEHQNFHIFDSYFFLKMKHQVDSGTCDFKEIVQNLDKNYLYSQVQTRNITSTSQIAFVINNMDHDFVLILVDIQSQKFIVYDPLLGRVKDTFYIHIKILKQFLYEYFLYYPPLPATQDSEEFKEAVRDQKYRSSFHSSSSLSQHENLNKTIRFSHEETFNEYNRQNYQPLYELFQQMGLDQVQSWQVETGKCTKISTSNQKSQSRKINRDNQDLFQKYGSGFLIAQYLRALINKQDLEKESQIREEAEIKSMYQKLTIELLSAKILN